MPTAQTQMVSQPTLLPAEQLSLSSTQTNSSESKPQENCKSIKSESEESEAEPEIQRTAGWSPWMLPETPRPLWVEAEKPSFMRRSRARDLGPELMGPQRLGSGLSYSFPCFLESILSLPHSRYSRNICQMRPQLCGRGCRFNSQYHQTNQQRTDTMPGMVVAQAFNQSSLEEAGRSLSVSLRPA